MCPDHGAVSGGPSPPTAPSTSCDMSQVHLSRFRSLLTPAIICAAAPPSSFVDLTAQRSPQCQHLASSQASAQASPSSASGDCANSQGEHLAHRTPTRADPAAKRDIPPSSLDHLAHEHSHPPFDRGTTVTAPVILHDLFLLISVRVTRTQEISTFAAENSALGARARA